jgi:putative ABC transport system substrate-binding protein
MERRTFLTIATGGLLAAPLAAEAQPAGRVWRIGYLATQHRETQSHLIQAFEEGLRERGYTLGRDIVIEHRSSEGHYERLPALAADLVRLKVDVIVAAATQNVAAAKQATRTIPIVMTDAANPVGTGLVASLARPGGNVTGLSVLTPEMVGKQLELLKELVPGVSRVAVLWNPTRAEHLLLLREAAGAGRSLGLQLQLLEARGPDDLERAFSTMTRERAGALLVLRDGMFLLHQTRIAALAVKSRLPAMYEGKDEVENGGLVGFGPSLRDSFRRAATYVDKILKGAKPSDLPVEQPTKFELVINLKTAKALGLTIPPSLLQRADQVIRPPSGKAT